MKLSKETQLMELAAPRTSYQDLLDAQKDLFHDQIEKLQQIVATQCKLTGVNPLSQEMAAGALSIRIGKRPRDLLNPKAVKYMQCVFSIKDAISKRETREISAQFGVTATQVRDFFNGQRSRVRKFVRLSREKAIKSSTCGEMHNEINSTLDPNMPVEPVPLETMAPTSIDEGPSCSKRDEGLTGMEESDQHFVQNIFNFMRREESFSGQVKLLQWILRTENPSVLNWFLTQGGLMILATWLSEAAKEEQTSFLRVMLKVLHYLPMRKALPVHMSAILQSVNRLRFYRTSDISHRARILLSKWSEMFGKNLSSKKSNGLKSASNLQDEMLLKQSINEVMGNESWDLKENSSEEALRFLCDNPDNHRKLDAAEPLKMLMASGDDSNKRRGVLSSYARERRKVQMVEHPSQRSALRGPQVARSIPVTQSRPLSADDIQKAKMRAQFMQSKYAKTTGSDEKVKPESQSRCNSSHASATPSVSKSCVQTEPEEQRKLDSASSTLANPPEASQNLEEPPLKKYKRIQIPWRTPSELKIDETWSVGDGVNSKEVEVQKNRIRREREIIYRSIHEIPSDPREPWDREMDHDDTLTPEIPIEQLPDVETFETPSSVSTNGSKEIVAPVASTSSESMPEPDLELLAALLKNPELVFALTSGQAGDLSSDATVKLLDMIKANGIGSLGNLAGNADNKVEVSLPSPTPSSDTVPNGHKPDLSRNPFSRQHALANGNAYQPPSGAALPSRLQGMAVPASTLMQTQIPATTILAAHPSATAQQLAHVVVPPVASLQTSVQLPEQWQATTSAQMHHQLNSSNMQHLTTEMMLNANSLANSNRAPTIWPEPVVKPSPASMLMQPSRSLTPTHPPKPPPSAYMQDPTLYHYQNYQNNQTVNNHNAYTGGAAVWGGRTNRPEFESWSPDNSPSRRHAYLPGQYYHGPSVELRHGYNQDRVMQQTPPYQDHRMGGAGHQRWRDHRR